MTSTLYAYCKCTVNVTYSVDMRVLCRTRYLILSSTTFLQNKTWESEGFSHTESRGATTVVAIHSKRIEESLKVEFEWCNQGYKNHLDNRDAWILIRKVGQSKNLQPQSQRSVLPHLPTSSTNWNWRQSTQILLMRPNAWSTLYRSRHFPSHQGRFWRINSSTWISCFAGTSRSTYIQTEDASHLTLPEHYQSALIQSYAWRSIRSPVLQRTQNIRSYWTLDNRKSCAYLTKWLASIDHKAGMWSTRCRTTTWLILRSHPIENFFPRCYRIRTDLDLIRCALKSIRDRIQHTS